MDSEAALKLAEKLSDETFRPNAEAADQGTIQGQCGENIRLLADHGFFGLGISPEYGGIGANDAVRREYAELIASACGVTAFTQQQLHSGGNFVSRAPSEELRREKLPLFASGQELCGVAFSHLRRIGKPMVRAEPAPGGYRISGTAPWVTGWSILDSFILGASLPDGSHLFCYVPKVGNESSLRGGEPIPLAVMNASDTVEAEIDSLFVPSEHVLSVALAENLRRSDFCGITGNVYLPLGCARGSALFLETLAQSREDSTIGAAAEEFRQEINACRKDALQWSGACADLPDYKERALRVRSEAIVLAVRAAHAAVAAMGGAAQLLSSPPQRLLREAMFYTTAAQTADVRSATLSLLTSPECWRND